MNSPSRNGDVRRRWLLLAAVFCACAIGDKAIGEEKPVSSRIPNVTLTTQNGQTVEFYKDLVKDKTVIISMMYTECNGICEQTSEKLVEVQKTLGDRLGRDVYIYSITLDPEHDTPEVLKQYAESKGAKPGWTFLTGSQADISALQVKLGLTSLSPEQLEKLGLPERASAARVAAANESQKQHPGMIVIGSDVSDRWHKLSIKSSAAQILQMVERLQPPSPEQE